MIRLRMTAIDVIYIFVLAHFGALLIWTAFSVRDRIHYATLSVVPVLFMRLIWNSSRKGGIR